MPALHRLWARRQRQPRFVAASLAVLAVLLAYPAIQWWLQSAGIAGEFRFYDLGAYRSAVSAWHAGDPLYVPNDDGGYHGSYLYPPVYVLLFAPLSELPFRQAGVAWNALSVALLWGGLQAVVAAYGCRLAWYERGLLLWAILGFHPVILSMRLAQVSVFLAGVLSVTLAALIYADRADGDQRLQYLAGAATAVAGTVKLVYAPTGAHLLANRRRFAAAVLTGVALLAVSLGVFGVDTHRAYLDVLAWGKGWGGGRPPSLWLPAYFRPLYVLGGTLSLVVKLGLSAVVAALAWLAAGEGVDDTVFGLGVGATPLLAPRLYTQDLTLVLPAAVVVLATELRRDGGYPTVPVLAVGLAAVHAYGLYLLVEVLPDRLPFGETLLDAAPMLQPGLWAAVLLAVLAGWRIAEAADFGRLRYGLGSKRSHS
jgi:alpha-1,2-mannosyltransferase